MDSKGFVHFNLRMPLKWMKSFLELPLYHCRQQKECRADWTLCKRGESFLMCVRTRLAQHDLIREMKAKLWLEKKVWGHWGFHYGLKEVCLCRTANFQTWYHKVKCRFATSDRKECPAVIRGEYLRSRPGQRGSSRLSLRAEPLRLFCVTSSGCLTHILIN